MGRRWTREEDDRLTELRREGLSTYRIAERMGTTQSSVAHRLRRITKGARKRTPVRHEGSREERQLPEEWTRMRRGGASLVYDPALLREVYGERTKRKVLTWTGVDDGPPCRKCSFYRERVAGAEEVQRECRMCVERRQWADSLHDPCIRTRG